METKYKDIDGRVIYLGDTVEFYWDEHLGYSDIPDDRYTKMTDLVEEVDGVVYFTCAVGGAFAWRHAEHCRVVDNPMSAEERAREVYGVDEPMTAKECLEAPDKLKQLIYNSMKCNAIGEK